MNVDELCDILRRRQVRVLPPKGDSDELRIDAPKGAEAITERLTVALKRHKDELLQIGFWYDDGDKRYWWGRCAGCGCVVQGAGKADDYPPPGEVFCLWCWCFFETSKRS